MYTNSVNSNEKKNINIVTKYKYTIVDDTCEKATNSRLYNFDYREGWKFSASSSNNAQPECYTSATSNPNKPSIILIEDVSEESSFTNSPPDSEDAVSSITAFLNKEKMSYGQEVLVYLEISVNYAIDCLII